MIRVLLTALMTWALCFSGSNCGSAKVQSPQNMEKKPALPTLPSLRLTNETPTGAFVIDAGSIPQTADVLEVSITKVVNPNQTPVSVSVYLNAFSKKNDPDVEKIPAGSFSIYPPDRPGKFLLSVPASSRKLPPTGMVQISFELKRVNESKPWTNIEVEVGRPTWRSDDKKH